MTIDERRKKIEDTLKSAHDHEEAMRLSLVLATAQVMALEKELQRLIEKGEKS